MDLIYIVGVAIGLGMVVIGAAYGIGTFTAAAAQSKPEENQIVKAKLEGAALE